MGRPPITAGCGQSSPGIPRHRLVEAAVRFMQIEKRRWAQELRKRGCAEKHALVCEEQLKVPASDFLRAGAAVVRKRGDFFADKCNVSKVGIELASGELALKGDGPGRHHMLRYQLRKGQILAPCKRRTPDLDNMATLLESAHLFK